MVSTLFFAMPLELKGSIYEPKIFCWRERELPSRKTVKKATVLPSFPPPLWAPNPFLILQQGSQKALEEFSPFLDILCNLGFGDGGNFREEETKKTKKERYEGFLLFFLFAIYFYFCFLEQLHVRTIGKLQGWWIEAPFLAFYPVTTPSPLPFSFPFFAISHRAQQRKSLISFQD